MVMVRVRGMGVAVMTRTSGRVPCWMSEARWTTPNLCCSSMTTRPRSEKREGS